MVEVRGLKKHFPVRKKGLFQKPGLLKAVDDVNFSIPEGRCLGLVGESRSGKPRRHGPYSALSNPTPEGLPSEV